jgi:hypothetical protein
MDVKHYLDLTKDFIKSTFDYWFIITFFLGVAALLSGHLIPNFSYKDESVVVGNVIVFSSVFASFTRWVSVTGIVKKTLNEILSSKEYLAVDKNFDIVLNNLIEVAIEKHNPSLKGVLEKSSIKSYFPQAGELYYSAYSQQFDVKWKDEGKRLLNIIETTKITVTTKDSSLYRMPYGLTATMPIGERWLHSIKSLKVGKKCCLDKVETSEHFTDNESQEDKFKINYTLELEGSVEYHIHRVMHREICLDFEPYIIVVSGKHTWMPEISCYTNDTGVKAAFNSTGTLVEFEDIAGRNNSSEFTQRHPSLMLKGQGYIICLSK